LGDHFEARVIRLWAYHFEVLSKCRGQGGSAMLLTCLTTLSESSHCIWLRAVAEGSIIEDCRGVGWGCNGVHVTVTGGKGGVIDGIPTTKIH
jgi:hypothetical protein